MKRIIKLFLFSVLQLQFLFASPLDEEFAKHFHAGEYNGRTIGRLYLTLGKPTYSYEYVVNKEYVFLTEKEPDYWNYFSVTIQNLKHTWGVPEKANFIAS